MATKIKIGVIPAAGPGKRMGYLGQILPKCLFPLYDRPIIHHVIDNMKRIEIEYVFVIMGYRKEKILEYFKNVKREIGIDVNFLHQKKLRGIADAVMLTEKFVSEPFMVILGDDCTLAKSLHNLPSLFFKRHATVVEGVVKEKNDEILKSTCCLVLGRNNRILKIVEKPKTPISNLRGCGLYVFHDKIFEYIKETQISPIRNEVEITDTINLTAKNGGAYAEFIKGINVNINTHDDLLLASNLMRRYKKCGHVEGKF